jgi:hypothetical protein
MMSQSSSSLRVDAISSVSVGKPAAGSRRCRIGRTDLIARLSGLRRTQVTALHALEDHVVTGLEREMEVRHQSQFRRNHPNSGSSISTLSSRKGEAERGAAQRREGAGRI